MKEKFSTSESHPKFWENEWLYCSTIM